MKSYIVNLEGKNEIRSIDELNTMLNYAIENENYELCSLIKEVIDNYDVNLTSGYTQVCSVYTTIKKNKNHGMDLQTKNG